MITLAILSKMSELLKKYSVQITVVAVIIAAYLIYRKIAKANTSNQITTNSDIERATLLYSAMGKDSIFSTSDTNQILTIAAQIRNYRNVADEYRVLYNSDLTMDLQNKLGKDYILFVDILKKAANENNNDSGEVIIAQIYDKAEELYQQNNSMFSIADCELLKQIAYSTDEEFSLMCDYWRDRLIGDKEDSNVVSFLDKTVRLPLVFDCTSDYENILIKRAKKLGIS